MRIKVDFDSDVAIRQFRYRFRDTVLARLDPLGFAAPTQYLCSCGHFNDGVKDGHAYFIDRCAKCGAANPRYEEYEYLNQYRHPGTPYRPFMWGIAVRAEYFEKEMAKRQRQIDAAKTRDKKAGLLIGNRPHTHAPHTQREREGEAV